MRGFCIFTFLVFGAVALLPAAPLLALSEDSATQPDPPVVDRPALLSLMLEFRLEGGAVRALAYSPDGKMLASGGDAGDIIFWDSTTGEKIAAFDAHKEGIGQIAFSPDGQRLLSAGGDVAIWGVPDAGLRQRFSISGCRHAVWSANGSRLAYANKDGAVLIRSASTGKVEKSLRRSEGIQALAFAPDSRRLAVGDRRGIVTVYDVESRSTVTVERLDLKMGISDIDHLPAGDLVTALEDGHVSWGTVDIHLTKRPAVIAVSPDGGRVAAGATRGAVYLWDTSGKRIGFFQDDDANVLSLAFSPDGKSLASGGDDGWIRIRREGRLRRLMGHAKPVESIAFSRNGAYIAAADRRRLRFVEVGTGTRTMAKETGVVSTGRQGAEFVVAGPKRISIWDARQGKRLRMKDRVDGIEKLEPIALSPDGESVAVYKNFEGVSLIHLSGKRRDIRFGKGYNRIRDLGWSPDGRCLATVNAWGMLESRGGLVLVNPEGKSIFEQVVPGPAWTVGFAPDGDTLAWAEDDRIHILNAHTFSEIRSREAKVRWWRFLRNDLAVSHDGETMQFWRLPSLELAGSIAQTPIVHQAASPDGRYLAVSDRFTVRVYRIEL
ncbi:MAG: WD40 repeat domain-containing protein [Planctomycetota bacterium]|nr:WD40 repeat domain-containing protein [Planctomycetota bacterium]